MNFLAIFWDKCHYYCVFTDQEIEMHEKEQLFVQGHILRKGWTWEWKLHVSNFKSCLYHRCMVPTSQKHYGVYTARWHTRQCEPWCSQRYGQSSGSGPGRNQLCTRTCLNLSMRTAARMLAEHAIGGQKALNDLSAEACKPITFSNANSDPLSRSLRQTKKPPLLFHRVVWRMACLAVQQVKLPLCATSILYWNTNSSLGCFINEPAPA